MPTSPSTAFHAPARFIPLIKKSGVYGARLPGTAPGTPAQAAIPQCGIRRFFIVWRYAPPKKMNSRDILSGGGRIRHTGIFRRKESHTAVPICTCACLGRPAAGYPYQTGDPAAAPGR